VFGVRIFIDFEWGSMNTPQRSGTLATRNAFVIFWKYIWNKCSSWFVFSQTAVFVFRHMVFALLKSSAFQLHFKLENLDCCVWLRKPELNDQNEQVRRYD
jgi:hypothetical protein